MLVLSSLDTYVTYVEIGKGKIEAKNFSCRRRLVIDQRLRISGVISLLLEVIGILFVWLGGHYLLFQVLGVILFVGPVIYLTTFLLRGSLR